MTYKAVGMIVGSTIGDNSNINIYVEVQGEGNRKLVLPLGVNSEVAMVRQIAFVKLAELCRAADIDQLRDTDDLNGVEVIVEYRADGENFRIIKIRPVKEVVGQIIRQRFWDWFWDAVWGRG